MNSKVEKTIDNLKKNGFEVLYFETKEEAAKDLIGRIEAGASMGFGGSVTVAEMGLIPALQEKGVKTVTHSGVKDPDEKAARLKEAMSTDYYCCSSNAITESGILVNIDATGNRLASMLYGHKRLFVVAGVNKITGTYEEAIIRIKNQACGPNCRRLGKDTPCAKLDKCMSCDSAGRLCRATLAVDRQPFSQPYTIYLINESLGY